MKALKQILSAALVLAMLLSCVGAASGEAVAQDGTPVLSDPYVEETPAPAEEAPAAAEEAPAPAEEAPAPAEEVPAAAEETPVPAEETPVPAEETPAPAEETPVPAEETPAAAEETPVPAEETPAPAEETPVPVEEAPAPAEEAPAPAEEAPAAAEEKTDEFAAVPADEAAADPEATDVPNVPLSDDDVTWTNANYPNGRTYNGSPLNVRATLKGNLATQYNSAVITYIRDGDTIEPKDTVNAGTYVVTAMWTKRDGTGTATATKEITISPVQLKVTTRIGGRVYKDSAYERTYTGAAYTTKNLNCAVTLSGVTPAKAVTASVELWKDGARLENGAVEADDYTVGYNLSYAEGVVSGNYTVAQEELSKLKINAAQLKIDVGAQTATYTGADIKLVKNGTWKVTGLVGNHVLKSVTVANSANVGQYDTLTLGTVEIVDGSGQSVNTNSYAITLTGTLEVTKATGYNPAVSVDSWTYGDAPSELEWSVTDGPGAEGYGAPTCTYFRGTEALGDKPTKAGEYTVKAVWKETDNLPPLEAEDSFTIAERDLALKATATEFYTGEEITVKFDQTMIEIEGSTSLAPGDQITAFSAEVSGTDVTGETAYSTNQYNSITISGGGEENYKITFTGTLTITQATGYTGTVELAGWKYGETASTEAAKIEGPGASGYDVPTYTYFKGTEALGTAKPKDAGEYTVVATWAAKAPNLPEVASTPAAFTIGKRAVTLTSANGEKTYDGQPLTAQNVVVSGDGFAAGEGVEFSDFASITNVASSKANNNTFSYTGKANTKLENYDITPVYGTLKIGKRAVTLTSADGEKTYDGRPLTAPNVAISGDGFAAGEGVEFSDFASITNVASNKANNNTFSFKQKANTDLNNYDVTPVYGTLKIAPKQLSLTASGEKLFGAEDPKAVIVTAPAAAATQDNWLRVVVSGLVNQADKDLLTITAKRVPGDAKELPGKYDIELAVDATKATNYTATGSKVANAFTITTDAAFTVSLEDIDEDDGEEYGLTTHTMGTVQYTITPMSGQSLIDDLQKYVDVTLDVDVQDADMTFVAPDAGTDEQGEPIENLPESIPQDSRETAGGEEPMEETVGSFTIPTVTYASGNMTWKSGLPAHTVLTAVVASQNETGASVWSGGLMVYGVNANMEITGRHGANRNEFLDGDPRNNGRLLLDGDGTVIIAPAKDSAEFVGNDDWIALTVGGKTHYYSNEDNRLGVKAEFGEGGSLTLTLDDLKDLAGVSGKEGSWFGLNPKGALTIKAVLVDNKGHTTEPTSIRVAFDTGAMEVDPKEAQTVGNRAAENVTLNILDSVNKDNPDVAVEGAFGGAAVNITPQPDGTLVWSNASAWMQSPQNLPDAGNQIKVSYRDAVGNPVYHYIRIVPSAAVTQNTIFVQPITNGTVPAKALRFYGDTTAWEACTLHIGDSQFPIDPLPGNASYESGNVKQWQQIVTLSDINFPVGVPTTVSIAYNDLTGGEATIEITYKDEAQTPVMDSETVAGSELLWGYVESGASVGASVYHADGSVTQIPQSSIAVDQFGYFCIRLGQALAGGEQVVISTSDFCGNAKSITVDVQEELPFSAAAELLGANVVGEIEGDAYHRFATPVDLAALAESETKSMTLPVLAYKGIEIGTVTLTLDDQGQLQMDYDIKAISYIPDGAKAYLGSFEGKPTIETLVKGSLPVAVEDLKANLSGSLPALDVSAHKNEDGEYSGVVWFQARFDIDMGIDSYVSRGSRDTRFYRWLTESLQTEDLLGAVYQETSAYEENVTYYGMYQRFENISRHS